jgi:hypothetical protein
MDSDATYNLMVDETEDLDTRAVAATDLVCWIANDGEWPAMTIKLGEAAVIDLCRSTIFRALDALATQTSHMKGD